MISMAELVPTADAAKSLGISQSALNSWARDGIVTPAFVTPGGQRRWDIDDLRRQLKLKPRNDK